MILSGIDDAGSRDWLAVGGPGASSALGRMPTSMERACTELRAASCSPSIWLALPAAVSGVAAGGPFLVNGEGNGSVLHDSCTFTSSRQQLGPRCRDTCAMTTPSARAAAAQHGWWQRMRQHLSPAGPTSIAKGCSGMSGARMPSYSGPSSGMSARAQPVTVSLPSLTSIATALIALPNPAGAPTAAPPLPTRATVPIHGASAGCASDPTCCGHGDSGALPVGVAAHTAGAEEVALSSFAGRASSNETAPRPWSADSGRV